MLAFGSLLQPRGSTPPIQNCFKKLIGFRTNGPLGPTRQGRPKEAIRGIDACVRGSKTNRNAQGFSSKVDARAKRERTFSSQMLRRSRRRSQTRSAKSQFNAKVSSKLYEMHRDSHHVPLKHNDLAWPRARALGKTSVPPAGTRIPPTVQKRKMAV